MYNDAYYGYVHYCTILTEEQRRSGTLEIQPVEISETMKEKRKKFKTYGNAVMYGLDFAYLFFLYSVVSNQGDKKSSDVHHK